MTAISRADQWINVTQRLGKSVESEYFDVPRGRVLVNIRTGKARISHGPATAKERLEAIATEFNLTEWETELDVHYFIGDDADKLFDD